MENQQTGRQVKGRQKVREKKEKDGGFEKYAVIMHNDNTTTMDFVVFVLQFVFFKSDGDAKELMMSVHNNGSAKVGTYVYDLAISKVTKAMRIAAENKFPLKLTCEKE